MSIDRSGLSLADERWIRSYSPRTGWLLFGVHVDRPGWESIRTGIAAWHDIEL
jgi:hypothetical protein